MSRADRGREQPRAMIHRRILDVAGSNPEASMASIADEVSGASTGLVERVLEEYGDPGNGTETDSHDDESMDTTNAAQSGSQSATNGGPADGDDEESGSDAVASPSESDGTAGAADGSGGEPAHAAESDDGADAAPESDDGADAAGATGDPGAKSSQEAADAGTDEPADLDLSEKQRRTLRAVRDRPDASQGDLAEELDVTRATISRRLNAIPGFEWADRRAFAESVFGDDGATSGAGSPAGDETATDREDQDEPGDDEGSSESETDREGSTDGGATEGASTADATAAAERADGSPSGAVDADAVAPTLAAIEERLAALEARTSERDGESGESLPPELAHKVVHACMESDRVSEDEELELLRTFMGE